MSERAEKAIRSVLTWAAQRCPCNNEQPAICPLCDARVDDPNGTCKAIPRTFPPSLLDELNRAISDTCAEAIHAWVLLGPGGWDGYRELLLSDTSPNVNKFGRVIAPGFAWHPLAIVKAPTAAYGPRSESVRAQQEPLRDALQELTARERKCPVCGGSGVRSLGAGAQHCDECKP